MNDIKTLQQLLQHSVARYSDKPALSFVDGVPLSYNDIHNAVANVQSMLCELGIKVGDKVAILSHNMPNWGIAYFAITTMGAVAVPLLPDFSANEIENILNHSGSKALFVSSRLAPKVDGCNTTTLQTKIDLNSFTVFEGDSASGVDDEPYSVKADDLATIVYTSGTTGKSKGVMLTHNNLLEQLKMIDKIQCIEASDILLSILPLPHMYECAIGFLLPLYKGASIYYLEKPPTATVLLPAVKKIRPTYMLSVPLIIEKIYRSNILPAINKNIFTRTLYKFALTRKLIHRSAARKLCATFGGRLKFFGIGGAKLDAVVERFLYEGKAFPYAIGYGLTETSPLLTAATPSIVRHQSAGFAIPGVTLIVHDPNPVTGEGEIWAKGANVMQGYYNEPELTAGVFSADGWFKTGDLGVLNHEGRLYIKGRLKNVILGASGENIYPEEIESVINNFKFVNDSLVLERKGKLVAMVRFNYEELEKQYQQFKEELMQNIEYKRHELEQKVEQLKHELLMYVNARVNRFSQISVVVVLPCDFEKTSTQKIKRYLYS